MIALEQLCERYSCLPKDILDEDAYYLNAFTSILRGKKEGIESRGNMKFTKKQIKRGLK